MKSPRIASIEEVLECSELSPKFDQIIDVRTPAEFAIDHLPGAINCPVLSNEERILVGTLYKQQSAFEANKVGAAIIARKIAGYIEHEFAKYPKDWKPLIYCWRGGNRSGAMAHILAKVGWYAHVLQGGYKNYRRSVVAKLTSLPTQLHFQVISGPTGSGKSRLLAELERQGAQVLDLEALANHRGSVLGVLEDGQPAQKWFETLIYTKLCSFKTDRPVFVESESRKVGKLYVPDELLKQIRQSPCIRLNPSVEERVKYLIDDYRHFIEQPDRLVQQLSYLKEHLGKEQIDHWAGLINHQLWHELVSELLDKHYDPLYKKSHQRDFEKAHAAKVYDGIALDTQTLEKIANELMSHSAH